MLDRIEAGSLAAEPRRVDHAPHMDERRGCRRRRVACATPSMRYARGADVCELVAVRRRWLAVSRRVSSFVQGLTLVSFIAAWTSPFA